MDALGQPVGRRNRFRSGRRALARPAATIGHPRMSSDVWGLLKEKLKLSDHDRGEQDWQVVESHCRAVIDQTSDSDRQIAWAWDLLGYAIERRGDLSAAITTYQQGAMASSFTDQAVRMNTHWLQQDAAKFSVAVLQKLDPNQVADSKYFSSLLATNTQSCRHQVVEYWMDQANQATSQVERHQRLMNAGWDIGRLVCSLLNATGSRGRSGRGGRTTCTSNASQNASSLS